MKPFVSFALAVAISMFPPAVFAAPGPVCQVDNFNGAMSCGDTLKSNEQRAACPGTDTIMVAGQQVQVDKPGCDNYPTLKWTALDENRFSVFVDPNPDPYRKSDLDMPGSGLDGFTLARIIVGFKMGGAKPQNFACKADASGAYLCDISTQFISLKCDGKQDPATRMIVQPDEIYKKPAERDKSFANRIVTFGYAELTGKICDARAQIKAYNATRTQGLVRQ